jgi:hypothetical protein
VDQEVVEMVVLIITEQVQVQLTQEVEVEVEAELAWPGTWFSFFNGGSGGSGIVIVRAPGSAELAASPGTNTVTTLPAPAGGCKVATFTVSGDLTIS